MLSPPSHLPHTSLGYKDSSRSQQDAVKLVPELIGEVVEGFLVNRKLATTKMWAKMTTSTETMIMARLLLGPKV